MAYFHHPRSALMPFCTQSSPPSPGPPQPLIRFVPQFCLYPNVRRVEPQRYGALCPPAAQRSGHSPVLSRRRRSVPLCRRARSHRRTLPTVHHFPPDGTFELFSISSDYEHSTISTHRPSCRHKSSFLSGKGLHVGLLGCMKSICSSLQETAKLFFQVAIPSASPPAKQDRVLAVPPACSWALSPSAALLWGEGRHSHRTAVLPHGDGHGRFPNDEGRSASVCFLLSTGNEISN